MKQKTFLKILFIFPSAVLYWSTLTAISNDLSVRGVADLGIALVHYNHGEFKEGKVREDRGMRKIRTAEKIEKFIPAFARLK